MNAVVPIKELTVRTGESEDFDDTPGTNQFVKLKFDDPQGVNNYYRWYWKESPDNNFSVMDTTYTTGYDEDRFFDGTELDFELTGIYNDDTRYLQVYQTAITRGAFDFFRQLDTQQSSGAGPFSPPPSPVRGNIVNKNDSRDFALGYFVVAGVTSAQIEITQ